MAPIPSRLAIDLSGNLIRVVEGNMGGSMQCGSSAAPEGASQDGKVTDPAALAHALKALLARIEVTQTRALVAASDVAATFRVLQTASSSTAQDVDALVAREMPFDPQRTATRWTDVATLDDMRTIYAVAWDRDLIKKVGDAVRLADIEPVVIELKSASVARTAPAASCVVVDLECAPAEIVLVDQHVPQVWHSFSIGDLLADNAVDSLASPLRSVLRFYRRRAEGRQPTYPVFVSGEQTLASQVLTELSTVVEQPVQMLPAPARVPANVRHPTYLACLGLMMRRQS